MAKLLPLLFPILLSAAAPSTDADTSVDLRCVVAMGSSMDTKNEQAKQLAFATMLYFLGRIDGRTPELDMKARYESEAKGMNPKEAKTFVDSCLDKVRKRLAKGL